MVQFGSTLIYDGKIWNNQVVHGIPPNCGVKESSANEAIKKLMKKLSVKSWQKN